MSHYVPVPQGSPRSSDDSLEKPHPLSPPSTGETPQSPNTVTRPLLTEFETLPEDEAGHVNPTQREKWGLDIRLSIPSWAKLHLDVSVKASILVILAVILVHAFRSKSGVPVVKPDALGLWIRQEEGVAKEAILRNIGPIVGAGDGLVVASPSQGEREEPDYYYTWTRDSALTISSLLPDFLPQAYLRPWEYRSPASESKLRKSHQDVLLEPLIRDYIRSQGALQTLSTPSGDLWTGGLNEPEFAVDGSPFTGPWGRPQRDGPALRALTLIPYALYLLDRSWPTDLLYVREGLYDQSEVRGPGKVIKNDLEEVANGWSQVGFDLWEEVNGHHLFTRVMSLRALQAGAILASRLDDHGAARFYAEQAENISQTIPKFHGSTWSTEPSWRATTFPPSGDVDSNHRTGLDCALPLTIIHAGSIRSSDDDLFSPSDPSVLITLKALVKSFAGLYPVNRERQWTDGWAVGRYSEDMYDGVGQSEGNPWFICTHSVAHALYLAKTDFLRQNKLELKNQTIPFWQDIFGPKYNLLDGSTLRRGGKGLFFELAMRRLGSVADGFLRVGREYSVNGSMSEQIDRRTGKMKGARDLTWSYASFLLAARARAESRSFP